MTNIEKKKVLSELKEVKSAINKIETSLKSTKDKLQKVTVLQESSSIRPKATLK